MKKIFILLILSIFLVACNNKVNEKEKTIINPLEDNIWDEPDHNPNEREIFIADSIINNAFSFHNPASIRVLEVGQDLDGKLSFIQIRIQGKNVIGGTRKKKYVLYTKDTKYSSKSIYKAGSIHKELMPSDSIMSDTKVSIKNINDLLTQHWESEELLSTLESNPHP